MQDTPPDSPPDPLAASLGGLIARHREAAGVSMSALAASAGMTRAYLWRVEHGHALASVRNVARIALALKVPVSRLMEGLDTTGVEMENRAYEKDAE